MGDNWKERKKKGDITPENDCNFRRDAGEFAGENCGF